MQMLIQKNVVTLASIQIHMNTQFLDQTASFSKP
jgi:hypothetical protein